MLHINRVGLNEVEFNRLFGADKTFYKLLVNVHPHIALEALHTKSLCLVVVCLRRVFDIC